MTRILSGIVVTLIASPVISLAAKGTVVLALGLTSTWFARRSRAAVRHALLASTFSVLLALPIVSVLATPVAIAVPVATVDSNFTSLFDYILVPSVGGPMSAGSGAIPAKAEWPLVPFYTMPLSATLLCGWFIGAALFMIPVIKGLLQIGSLRRSGLPWRHGQVAAESLAPGVRRQVEVLLHESLPGPMTSGVLHPVIILPADAQSWNKQDLERALVHELEHVRRYDWAIHCLARVACAAYWFHPLVWTAWRQLTLEAERSCDDAVLGSSEATAYADQLVGLARRRRLSAAHKSPALAMANRSDLSLRVRAVLDNRQQRGRAGTLLVAVACAVATGMVLTMSSLRMIAAPQSSPAQSSVATHRFAPEIRPKFEVASIKPCDKSGTSGRGAGQSPGRLDLHCAQLRRIIEAAYGSFANGVTPDPTALMMQAEGGPGWIDSDLYDIVAKAPDNATLTRMLGPMMQTLLEDRFKLKVHGTTREVPVYILSVAKGGPKLTVAREGSCIPLDMDHPPPPPSSGQPPPAVCGGQRFGSGELIMSAMTMAGLSTQLSLRMDREVIDRTGLAGTFDIRLQLSPDEMIPTKLKALMMAGEPAPPAPPDPAGSTIFDAVQKLGLKLESGKGPVGYLVIDSIQRPSEN